MTIERNDLQSVLNEIDVEITNLKNLRGKVQAMLSDSDVVDSVLVSYVRYIGVLDDIYEQNGVVTAKELSDIAKKWGRNPKGTAGYYTGANPSLLGIANGKRALTDKGSNSVKDFRSKYGADWKNKIDMNLIGNPDTAAEKEISIVVEK